MKTKILGRTGLATGPVEGASRRRRGLTSKCLDHVRNIQALCSEHKISLLEASLRWATRHPQVAMVIPGGRNPEEAKANAKVGEAEIPEAFWEDLAPMIRHWDEAYPFG